jgi:RND family efflux transporter MFP subunit
MTEILRMEEQKRSRSLNGPAQSGPESSQGKMTFEQGGIATQNTAALPMREAATKEVTPKEEKARQKGIAGKGSSKASKKKFGSARSAWTIAGSFVLLVAAISGVMYYITENARDVTLYQVGAAKNVQQFVGGGGITYPRQQFDLSYASAERVVSVLVNAGDHVTVNQPLIKLDPSQLNAQINQAANDVAAARSYLYSVSGAINQVTVAAAQQQLQVAQNHYNSLLAQTSSDTLKNGSLVSPLNGTITSVNINPGEVFAANAILLTIMDQSTVTIRAKIPLSNLRQVKVGMPALVTPSALPDVSLSGVVSSIIQQADPQTDTVEVWVEVKNTQQTLLPGMSAFVQIQGQINAFAVPRLAVLNPDHNSVVFVERGNKVYLETVHVASRGADVVYVDQGLTAGDKIVLIPLDKMHDGQQVTVSQVEH